jgi:serine protease inhibitor
MKEVQLTPSQKAVISRSNAFGFEFFKTVYQYADTTKNLMVSPLSVSMALGMSRNGAANATLDSMTGTLGFSGMSDTEINESFKYIVETFTELDPKVKLSIANSIWYRNTFPVEPAFINTNTNYFNAATSPLDFASPSAVATINNWVSEKTSNLIPKIIETIPDNAVMYLINAIYFKGEWRYRFDTEKTVPKPFYLMDGSSVETPSMAQQEHLLYLDGDGFAAVELPYNQGNYTMTVMLPDYNSSLAAFIGQLSQENMNEWRSGFAEAEVVLQLPKFKYAHDEKKMREVLTQMGMGVAFDPEAADFSRINPNGDLYISDVKHKTFIETNEEGTEAAAVTSVEVGITSVGPGGPVYFTVDRPFVYFISEKSTGTILFIGIVANPTEN